MANTRKIVPVPLSTLPQVEDSSGFWIFGSKEKSDGTLESMRYNFDNLAEYARRLQLERRITLRMETSTTDIFTGEAMTVYKVEAKNVGSLKINGAAVNLAVINSNAGISSANLELSVNQYGQMAFEITPLLTDPVAYLYVYGRVNV